MIDYNSEAIQQEIIQILERTNKLKGRGARRVAKNALMAGNRYLRVQAKNIAPVRTGLLKRKGIEILDRRGKPGDVLRSTATARREKLGISADSKWYYPAIVEYGVKKGPRQFRGRRFMERTYLAHEERAKRIIIDRAKVEIEKELAKGN